MSAYAAYSIPARIPVNLHGLQEVFKRREKRLYPPPFPPPYRLNPHVHIYAYFYAYAKNHATSPLISLREDVGIRLLYTAPIFSKLPHSPHLETSPLPSLTLSFILAHMRARPLPRPYGRRIRSHNSRILFIHARQRTLRAHTGGLAVVKIEPICRAAEFALGTRAQHVTCTDIDGRSRSG